MSNEVLWLGGIFNFTDPLFNWQLYIWSWVILIIFSIVCYVAFYYGKWMPFRPLHGLYYAFKAGSYAAFVMNPSLICELVSEREGKCIFDYSKATYEIVHEGWISYLLNNRIGSWFYRRIFNYATTYLDDLSMWKAFLYKLGKRNMDVEIARKLQNYEWEEAPSVTIQGIRTDIILDGDNWTFRPSPQHKAIEKAADLWNEMNPTDQIHSYSKLQKYFLQNKIQVPSGVKTHITVPWVRIDSAFPINLEDNEMAGPRRQAAEELSDDDRSMLTRLYLPILGGGMVLGILMYILRFVGFIMAKG